jgi:mannose-6-phosphate isomerase class I
MSVEKIIVTTIITNTENVSVFAAETFFLDQKGGMFLTPQIPVKNFRLRKSKVGYQTDFHMAGDATLITILKGKLRITLQNKEYQTFNPGESFIAKDNLPNTITFNPKIHGHQASVVGTEDLEAIHMKL